MSATPTREEQMVVIARDENGKPTVWCDPEIVDLVTALNTGSLRTLSSCSGHGHRPGYIALADGRWLIVANDGERKIIDAAFPVDINGAHPQSKENRVSDERLTLIASGIADRLGAGASGAPDLERDIASAITELLSLRSKPVAGVELKPLIDWLRKRGESDGGIRYEGASSNEFARRPARVELHGADADFVAKHFHGSGARALADILSALILPAQEPVGWLSRGERSLIVFTVHPFMRDEWADKGMEITPLYASPQPEAVITEEMVERAYEAFVAACEWSDWDEPEVRGYLRAALTAALKES